MMAAAAAAAAAASPVGVRSKVKVPEVVNCPDGDTVTVEGGGQDTSEVYNVHSTDLHKTFNILLKGTSDYYKK